MNDQNELKEKDHFDEEMEILEEVLFNFELEGVKAFFILEKNGEAVVVDKGITGKAIVSLVLEIASNHSAFFGYAVSLLNKMKKEFEEEKENATVH